MHRPSSKHAQGLASLPCASRVVCGGALTCPRLVAPMHLTHRPWRVCVVWCLVRRELGVLGELVRDRAIELLASLITRCHQLQEVIGWLVALHRDPMLAMEGWRRAHTPAAESKSSPTADVGGESKHDAASGGSSMHVDTAASASAAAAAVPGVAPLPTLHRYVFAMTLSRVVAAADRALGPATNPPRDSPLWHDLMHLCNLAADLLLGADPMLCTPVVLPASADSGTLALEQCITDALECTRLAVLRMWTRLSTAFDGLTDLGVEGPVEASVRQLQRVDAVRFEGPGMFSVAAGAPDDVAL